MRSCPHLPLVHVLTHAYLLFAHSIAIFCACLALALGLEIVVFSPARRASRKLLERIVEFIVLAGGKDKIVEYNQEACRLHAFDGKKSLIRSFPSKVGVCATTLEHAFRGFRPWEEEAPPPSPSLRPLTT